MIPSAVNPNLALCLRAFYECHPSHDPSSPDDFPLAFPSRGDHGKTCSRTKLWLRCAANIPRTVHGTAPASEFGGFDGLAYTINTCEIGVISMADQYGYGRKKEELVARKLRGYGAKVDLMPGSRGAYDLEAAFPGGTKWLVEVKSTRSGKPASLTLRESGRLKQTATKRGSTAVIAYVARKSVEFYSARDGRKLNPPKSK